MRADPVAASKTRAGIVGGGVLGLTLALRLAKLGHHVELFEASPELGGLAASHHYGPFDWDRFYHCILPQDRHLIGLLGDLGLGQELRWKETGTGYYARGRWFPMSKSTDYLTFPLLSWVDKARVGATVIYATLAADPAKLYAVSAEEWLIRWCGRRGYEAFWRPLLRAKFGPFYDQVAAVFIWATLTRLFGARSGAASKEKLGYVRGGYRTVLERFEKELLSLGAIIRKSSPVNSIRRSPTRGCEVHYGKHALGERATFDQVVFTGPTRLARQVVDASLLPIVERAEDEHPAAAAYLGVACLVLAMKRRLTPFYVLNVGDERIELTGVIEMTNLVDRDRETAGLSLVYVPQYMDSSDPRLSFDDGVIENGLVDRGLLPMFPDLSRREFVYHRVHRARLVQPLPLVRQSVPRAAAIARTYPLQMLNTSMLTCATLNNDEVVAFVDRFVEANGGLGAPRAGQPSSRVGLIDVFPSATTRAS